VSLIDSPSGQAREPAACEGKAVSRERDSALDRAASREKPLTPSPPPRLLTGLPWNRPVGKSRAISRREA